MGWRVAVETLCVGFSQHTTVMMEMGWKWQDDTTRLTSFVVKLTFWLKMHLLQRIYTFWLNSEPIYAWFEIFDILSFFALLLRTAFCTTFEIYSKSLIFKRCKLRFYRAGWFLGHMVNDIMRQFSLFWTKVTLLVNFNFGHHVSDWTIDSLFQSPVTQSRLLLFHPKLRRRRRIFLHLYLISFAMPYPETVGAKTHCAKMEFILYWLQE